MNCDGGMNARPRVGLILVGIGELAGGGGTERYFIDLYNAYRVDDKCRLYDLTMITDRQSLAAFSSAGRRPVGGIPIIIGGGRNILRLGQILDLWRIVRKGKFDLLHITVALPRHLPWLWLARRLSVRTKVTLNVNDYTLYDKLSGTGARPVGTIEARAYQFYFSFAALDGIMCWYKAVSGWLKHGPARKVPIVHAARYCFVDTRRFRPTVKKENQVVFAGRLVPEKRPALFIEGLAIARHVAPELIADWKFSMYGRGPLQASVNQLIRDRRLGDLVTLDFNPDLTNVFARSKVFVSTQDDENFTSLSMLEAMACANAIIARDAGQTRQFVRPGENGILINDDDPASLADALVGLLGNPRLQQQFGKASRTITENEHCAENAVREFDEFWHEVIAWQPEVRDV